MHEFELINNYFSNISKKNKAALNLNDDVFFDKKKGLVISVDTYNIGTHFIDFKRPDLVIKKILRSSISDLICKGVDPKYYFIAGSGNKKNFTKNNLKKISNSLREEQKKYNLLLGGGDTTFSNKLSFTITSVGYSKKIIYRNQSNVNNDIYVTGNLGDSFIGLQVLKNKIKLNKSKTKYFINKYYMPDIQNKFSKNLLSLATSSMDISDGLITDLNKLINKQNVSYKIYEKFIPVSRNLTNLINSKNLKKIDLVSNGDDYQILFTAKPNNARIINKLSKSLGVKISKIGTILSGKNKSLILDQKGREIANNAGGYIHQF